MTTTTESPINTANRIAPAPATEDDATRDAWVRHYAAQALACWATFRREIRNLTPNPEPGSRPDIGYLALAAVASTAAAAALIEDPDPVLLMDAPNVTALIWELTPELGALNGEYEDWLTEVLVRYGVNPGEIDPDLDPRDFNVEDWRLEATKAASRD
ncbi:hypothetical protein [Micromonospora sp. NPDC005299]|uniref:hypothetical protein n=1 Tax=Micromonospora sp. NPDC005299 TaxID=3364231 RepID=UPI00368E16E7